MYIRNYICHSRSYTNNINCFYLSAFTVRNSFLITFFNLFFTTSYQAYNLSYPNCICFWPATFSITFLFDFHLIIHFFITLILIYTILLIYNTFNLASSNTQYVILIYIHNEVILNVTIYFYYYNNSAKVYINYFDYDRYYSTLLANLSLLLGFLLFFVLIS